MLRIEDDLHVHAALHGFLASREQPLIGNDISAQALLIAFLASFFAFIAVFPLPLRAPWLLGCSLFLRVVFLA